MEGTTDYNGQNNLRRRALRKATKLMESVENYAFMEEGLNVEDVSEYDENVGEG